MLTKHAEIRSCQRAIPPLITDLLQLYGSVYYTGKNVSLKFFSKKSKQKMSKDLGGAVVGQLSRFFNIYLVESIDGDIVTVARRNNSKRMKSKKWI